MRLYSRTLDTPKDHRKPSEWVFDRYWNITKVSQLNIIIKKLDDWTKYDKKGRILCVGFPSKDMALQKRVYVVKFGHDGNLFTQVTPRYNELRGRLNLR